MTLRVVLVTNHYEPHVPQVPRRDCVLSHGKEFVLNVQLSLSFLDGMTQCVLPSPPPTPTSSLLGSTGPVAVPGSHTLQPAPTPHNTMCTCAWAASELLLSLGHGFGAGTQVRPWASEGCWRRPLGSVRAHSAWGRVTGFREGWGPRVGGTGHWLSSGLSCRAIPRGHR